MNTGLASSSLPLYYGGGIREESMMAVKLVPVSTEKPSPRAMRLPARKVAPGLTTCTPDAVIELQA